MLIELISATVLTRERDAFSALVRDAVAHGASIGFTLPLSDGELAEYWHKVGLELAAGNKILLIARGIDRGVVGSAQLALESRANGRHRAEVQKVMVLAAHRGQGLGAALMTELEAAARQRGRKLLLLDTSVGAGGAVKFYERLGYTFAGSIPDYAADPDGQLVPNAIFYKQLKLSAGDARL
jgi:acetyltransferase